MDFLDRMFDWTWHLSSNGKLLWGLFMAINCTWYCLGIFVYLSFNIKENNTLKICRNLFIYVFTPIITIGVVGFIGYLING